MPYYKCCIMVIPLILYTVIIAQQINIGRGSAISRTEMFVDLAVCYVEAELFISFSPSAQ